MVKCKVDENLVSVENSERNFLFIFQVVHGDIKLDNIVITKDLKNVAICDFGTAGQAYGFISVSPLL